MSKPNLDLNIISKFLSKPDPNSCVLMGPIELGSGIHTIELIYSCYVYLM